MPFRGCLSKRSTSLSFMTSTRLHSSRSEAGPGQFYHTDKIQGKGIWFDPRIPTKTAQGLDFHPTQNWVTPAIRNFILLGTNELISSCQSSDQFRERDSVKVFQIWQQCSVCNVWNFLTREAMRSTRRYLSSQGLVHEQLFRQL